MGQAQIRSRDEGSDWAADTYGSAPQSDVLARLQRSFTMAQEVGRIGSYEIDLRDGSAFATPSFFEHLGLPRSRDQIGREEWLALVHPDDRSWMIEHLNAASATSGAVDTEYRIVRADGTIRWITARAQIELGPDGAPRWAYGVQQDTTDRKRAEAVLRESELRFRTVAEQSSDLVYSYDVDAGRIEWFGEVDRLFGYAPGLFPRTIAAWEAYIHPEDRSRTLDALHRHINAGEPFDLEYRTISLDGTVRLWVERGTLIPGSGGACIMVGAMTDVTEQRRSISQLAESEARFRNLADHLPMMVWVTRADQGVSFLNRQWEDFSGRRLADGLGGGWLGSIHPDDAAFAEKMLAGHRAERRAFQIDHRMIRYDGESRWMMNIGVPRFSPDDEFLGFAGAVIEITERKLAEQHAAWSADHDSLTQLANRGSFQRELRSGLALAGAAGMRAAVILLDLDHLKLVNDTLGHDAGDALIRTVGARLAEAVGQRGIVARLGGDEFGILLVDVASRAEAMAQASHLASLAGQPVPHSGGNLDCRGSIGLTIFPDDSLCPDELLKNADLALYEAKSRRGTSVATYRPALRAQLRLRTRASAEAQRCLSDDRITPYYQPRIDLATGALSGFEALLRMRGAHGKVHPPGRILTAFEDPKLALAVGKRMLDRVLADIAEWQEAGRAFCRVAINASELEFRSGGYADRVLRTLERSGVAPDRLEIEVTETVLVSRDTRLISNELSQSSRAGVLIALDDFGTGYASLTHLKQFPVDIIKIDRSFAAILTECEDGRASVRAIVGLGQSLGKTVIAEGVETAEQAHWLRRPGCELGQSYFFARPMSAARAVGLAGSWASLTPA